MNYYFTGVLIVLLCLLTLCVKPAHSGSTQSNVSGSNTAIAYWAIQSWKKGFKI